MTKSKERYVPEKLEFDEALQEAFTKFVQGRFDELMQATDEAAHEKRTKTRCA